MTKIEELKGKIKLLFNEKLNLEEKHQDIFNRLKQILSEKDDLLEKIKRYEDLLSINNQSNTKPVQFNSLNNGINLDYLSLNDMQKDEKKQSFRDLNKIDGEKFTINVKLNLKKNLNHNYGLNNKATNLTSSEIGKKKGILQISELMTQKPLSKV